MNNKEKNTLVDGRGLRELNEKNKERRIQVHHLPDETSTTPKRLHEGSEYESETNEAWTDKWIEQGNRKKSKSYGKDIDESPNPTLEGSHHGQRRNNGRNEDNNTSPRSKRSNGKKTK